MVQEAPINKGDEESYYLAVGKKRFMLKTVRAMLLVLAVYLLGVGSGYTIREEWQLPWLNLSAGKASDQVNLGLDRSGYDFSLFWGVWDTLEAKYLEPDKINQQKMIYGAISGMTAALDDPYTVFLPPSDNQQSKEDLAGEFDGIGVQLGYKKDTLAVMSPLDEHPAIKQGVRAGDLILHIKDETKGIDQDTNGLSLPEAVKLIRGKKGVPVTLTLYREEKGTFEVTIVRDTITVPSVEMEIGEISEGKWVEMDGGTVAWVKVRRFGDNTQAQWDQAVVEIAKNRDRIKGLVLDVRNNPGGYLEGAVDLASEFIGEGVVVTQQGKEEKLDYTVTRRGRLLGMPLVVLVNGGSASASEILAGALRDRTGAKLVGEKSFGKGTVQDAMDLPDNAGLHVTIARWLLPSGDWIHEDGLTPDVEVKLGEELGATGAAELVDTQLTKAVEVLAEE